MTYSIYIKKDYKTVIERSDRRRRHIKWWCVGIAAIAVCTSLAMTYHPNTSQETSWIHSENNSQTTAVEHFKQQNKQEKEILNDSESHQYMTDQSFELTNNNNNPITEANSDETGNTIAEDIVSEPEWTSVVIQKGDNLSLIFDRLHLSPQILFNVISLSDKTNVLKHLMPGQEIHFQISDGQLNELKYDINLTDTLHITRTENIYSTEIKTTPLEIQVSEVSGIINSSLFLSAQKSGLTDNLTMQLIELYGWDIDFALDIRKGDRFYVYYEERYKNGEKVQDGPILAAEFINQGKVFRAVRYTHTDGHTDYYSDTGHSMRKAFLRTPVNFTRISSRFNLSRKHPILNKIRAHRGVDYAAPAGTIIKAAGDGIVSFAGRQGGYGNLVMLRHGEKYTTVYGHMSRFARGIKTGMRVKQGQTIGYVGQSGLATGPHLHYEFRINGVHRNPLTVELPKALRIPENIMDDFKTQTSPLIAQLVEQNNKYAASKYKPSIVALNEETEEIKNSH